MTIQEMIQKNKERLNELLRTMDDANAVRFYLFYPRWNIDAAYAAGERIHYNGHLYRVLEDHVSAEGMEPGVDEEKYCKIEIPAQNTDAK